MLVLRQINIQYCASPGATKTAKMPHSVKAAQLELPAALLRRQHVKRKHTLLPPETSGESATLAHLVTHVQTDRAQ